MIAACLVRFFSHRVHGNEIKSFFFLAKLKKKKKEAFQYYHKSKKEYIFTIKTIPFY
jgi:hypothetical protein